MIEAAVAASLDLDMAVSNSLVFTQTDDFGYFLLDDSQTYANPDPPQLGKVVNFVLGGLWTQPVDIDHIKFQCHLFGVLVYDEDFPD